MGGRHGSSIANRDGIGRLEDYSQDSIILYEKTKTEARILIALEHLGVHRKPWVRLQAGEDPGISKAGDLAEAKERGVCLLTAPLIIARHWF